MSQQAVSYCGLCSVERSSTDKLVRMPIYKGTSTFRRFLWRPRNWPLDTATNCPFDTATNWPWSMSESDNEGTRIGRALAVARKRVAYMLAVERKKQDFVPAEELGGTKAA